MNRNSKLILVFAAVALLCASAGFADSLAVNNTAALGGTGTACGGSNCGLEVTHDNSSAAFVRDDTPVDESVYRATWLMNVAAMSTSSNFRQTIFNVIGDNPNPGVGSCSAGAFQSAFRCFEYQTGGIGQNSSIQCFVRGNQCGERAVTRIPVTVNNPFRVCVEWTAGGSNTGLIALAVVDDQASCPPSGDAAYNTNTVSNQLTNVQFVQLGTPQLNGFGAGEAATYHFDEFESFRTLAAP